ncbi:MAG TPA: fumarylacetoacetase [Candidatus Krumholzibacteria bacterium]|nr:fumarylacetoacetase [Candidatus Krumholzibacteria bacterium]
MTNATHRPELRSWVESANGGKSDFPIQNLPFGVFRDWEGDDSPRVGVAIGDRVLDVSALRAGLFAGAARRAVEACAEPLLNPLMALGGECWTSLRARLSELLSADHEDAHTHRRSVESALFAMSEVEMLVPALIGDYTDFYASVFHATNVGSMFRPDNPLLPNYKHVPIGYHGRASSIVASGTPVRRPQGQTMADGADAPVFGPSRLLDYEVEVGAYVGPGNPQGEPVPLARAHEHLFGLCLVNDWSARDIQKWEYQPLGPFLAKSFATTVSPWIVTAEALAPFRAPAFARPEGDPAPLPYLRDDADQRAGGFDITIEAFIETPQMRSDGFEGVRVSRASFRDMYWTLGQMLAHHTSNGCNLRPGDLLASGTVSGEARESAGCLLERTWRGSEPIELPSGETRRFLEDGDTVILRAYCERAGAVRIGFGECRGAVLPAE